MLEKPDLHDEKIIACLRSDYGIQAAHVTFLPLGADHNAAVYRVVATDAAPYFLKLRSGPFDPLSVTLPRFLRDRGINNIIAPLATTAGQLWTSLDDFAAILYPFIRGRNGYAMNLTDRHWIEFGAALKCIHTVAVPSLLVHTMRQEAYSSRWRDVVLRFLQRPEAYASVDAAAARAAALLVDKRDVILDLVRRAGYLAAILQVQSPPFVVCHSDIHAGNVLIDDAAGALYIIDWDEPVLAPKERDLMYAGAGLFANRRTPQQEETLFYQGYGETQVDPGALAYYRYERIVMDIAVYCEQLLLTGEGGEDRERSLHYLMSNFSPGNTIAIAYHADRTAYDGWKTQIVR